MKDRQESLSIGPKKKSSKLRDLSALPAYNREMSAHNIVDVRKV